MVLYTQRTTLSSLRSESVRREERGSTTRSRLYIELSIDISHPSQDRNYGDFPRFGTRTPNSTITVLSTPTFS